MISTSVPYMPVFSNGQSAQSDRRTANPPRPDPLHLLSRDSIRQALTESAMLRPELHAAEPYSVASNSTTLKILAGSVALSTLGAAGLVAHIVREHVQAKHQAAQAKNNVHAPVAR